MFDFFSQKKIRLHNANIALTREQFWKEYDKSCENLPKIDDSKIEVIIKPEALDTSALESTNDNKKLWRPQKFEEYIGQTKAKELLQAHIEGSKRLNENFPHLLISGLAGTGKTTLLQLVANKLNLDFVYCIAETLKSPQQVVDKIVECKGGILMIDEIHGLSRQINEFLLPIIEDFRVNNQYIKKFSLFGATTELGQIIKKFKPFLDRFPLKLTLESYTHQNLAIIAKQFKEKTFPNIQVDDSIYELISKNCRETPRLALSLLKSYIFIQDIKKVLYANSIVKDGITEQDIKLLKYLEENPKGVGLNTISLYLQTSEANYQYSIESYLLKKGLITRLPRGRIITEKGKEFLKCL